MFLPGGAAAAAQCAGDDSPRVQVAKISPDAVLRARVPEALFGFDFHWYNAQIGYMREGRFRPEFVEWMRPFRGAMYRYPSGDNTFNWRKAVGPVATRPEHRVTRTTRAVPLLGPEELLHFLDEMGAQPLWMLNVYGPEGKRYPSREEMQRDVLEYAAWIHTNAPKICKKSPACRNHVFEFGNELDTSGDKWSAEEYVQWVEPLLKEMRAKYPQSKLVVLGKSAPWSSKTPEDKSFDSVVASRLAAETDGVSFHPYYDGNSVRSMIGFIDALAGKYRRINPNHQVYVTEHARWPSKPAQGRWEDNWYQASGSAGGVSSADFILGIIPNERVAAAIWHALGVVGPWQLIRWDKKTDSLYPSPTYWALRVVRDAFLQDAVRIDPATVPGKDYWGGYDLRLVAMRGSDGRLSILGVNRSRKAYLVQPQVDGRPLDTKGWRLRRLVADARGSDNVDDAKERFVMERTNLDAASVSAGVCVPPASVFSITKD